MKTFWMSFCDEDKPAGEQFLGVCVIDVTQEEADDQFLEVALRFPQHLDGAEWVAAAARKAYRLNCNPGGQVMNIEIPEDKARGIPRNKLLSKDQLAGLGLI
jgi:hypothetical protein